MQQPLVGSGATPREVLLDRARALAPKLRSRVAACNDLRRIPDETVADLRASGLIRIGNPERFGGLGTDYDPMFEVAEALGRVCASTAWCYAVWTVHNYWVGHFPLDAQEEFFGGGPDVLASSALQFTGKGEPAAGGFRLTGHWSFSSGCDAATWAILGLATPAGNRWALVPRADYRIVDNWFVSGLQGTGSKDLVVDGAFVPVYRVLDPAPSGETDLTAWELHRRPSYRVPRRVLSGYDLAAPVIGAAQGAVDAHAERLAAAGTPAGVAAGLRLAESAAEVDAARALLHRNIGEMLADGAAGRPVAPVRQARYLRDRAFVATLCARAAARLADAGGGRAVFEPNPVTRLHRDVQTALHHHALSWDAHAEPFARSAIQQVADEAGLG